MGWFLIHNNIEFLPLSQVPQLSNSQDPKWSITHPCPSFYERRNSAALLSPWLEALSVVTVLVSHEIVLALSYVSMFSNVCLLEKSRSKLHPHILHWFLYSISWEIFPWHIHLEMEFINLRLKHVKIYQIISWRWLPCFWTYLIFTFA